MRKSWGCLSALRPHPRQKTGKKRNKGFLSEKLPWSQPAFIHNWLTNILLFIPSLSHICCHAAMFVCQQGAGLLLGRFGHWIFCITALFRNICQIIVNRMVALMGTQSSFFCYSIYSPQSVHTFTETQEDILKEQLMSLKNDFPLINSMHEAC